MDNMRIVGDYKFPKWTRKDFQFLADILHDLQLTHPLDDSALVEIAHCLNETNSNFQEERFLKACEQHYLNEALKNG